MNDLWVEVVWQWWEKIQRMMSYLLLIQLLCSFLCDDLWSYRKILTMILSSDRIGGSSTRNGESQINFGIIFLAVANTLFQWIWISWMVLKKCCRNATLKGKKNQWILLFGFCIEKRYGQKKLKVTSRMLIITHRKSTVFLLYGRVNWPFLKCVCKLLIN